MTREEAIKIVRENYPHFGTTEPWLDLEKALATLIPELADSEDERIRKELKEAFEAYDIESTWNGIPIRSIFAWLEKQKEQPTDAKLERVIKASRRVLNNWLDGADCPDVSGDFAELEYAIREYDGEEKQKEPHYTKRNALFDKCIENCDPKTVEEVNKRVDDIMNMPELSAFEQALTNFIGYWEDDEEHWPSQFVKKHGKHILDMAREELEKEQKPVPISCSHENGSPAEVCYSPKGDPDPAGVWKPSEEQMTNLLRAEGRLRIEGESILASKLAELYAQLKKLM